MNVCRICLANNTKKLSINETEQGISYYSMLIFFANIKTVCYIRFNIFNLKNNYHFQNIKSEYVYFSRS